MKTLENQTLLYDEDCPLCKVYTAGFINAGMLDKNGKKPFSNLSEEEQTFIDIEKAKNQIALVDNKNKTVSYGIDSLLKVIGNSFPWVEKVGNFKPIKFFLNKLYSFISYNRKVIIPNKNSEKAIKCIPSFNFKYRIFYILFAGLATASILFHFSNLLPDVPKDSFGRELILAFGQILFQSIFLLKVDKKTILTYFGNVMTVSFFGSLLLTPLIILNQITKLPQLLVLVWFGITVMTMFVEHSRRVKILKLPHFLCYTWVLYRIIALFIILNL